VDIVDLFMASRRASVAEMLHIPSLANNHKWSRSCGTPMREALSPQTGVQVAVAAGRGCGHPWVANPEWIGRRRNPPFHVNRRPIIVVHRNHRSRRYRRPTFRK
jgi:hypothetical protein